MATVYFSLGSNVGNRRKYLDDALAALKENVSGINVSPVYRTAPWGNQDQPEYLNLCAGGKTSLEPLELLRFIKSLEIRLGRVRSEKWGPREIDIDIIFYDDRIIDSPALKLPHPYLPKRAFVLIPLAEIAPKLVHPVLQKNISELARAINPEGVVKLDE